MSAILRAHNLRAILHPPGSTATAQMAADRLGVALGQIANTLLWVARADYKPLLLIIGGDSRVSSGKLKRLVVGSAVRMARSDEIVSHVGSYPGAVCPFVNRDIPIFIERSLQRYSVIYPAAGTDCSSVEITYRQLCEICHAQECDFRVC